ncbi:EamA family transporter [Methyloglobulus sp.]|uniref:EamA family transporter n=1 Tax=Methyloglobulus sp. TaxID=2518622 RepID=UPI0039895850
MWLYYALLGPPFWAIVHILDSHCVGNVFDRPWMGVITSSLATAVIALIALFFLPGVDWQLPEWHIIALALLAGGLIQLGQGFYFQALEKTEAGIVAAYGNFTPTLLPLVSYFLIGDVLELWHYITIGVLVIASICFCLIDVSRHGKWDSVLLMLMASTAQVAAILIEKYVFEQGTFFTGFAFVIMGVVLSGVLPILVVPSVRKAFSNNIPKLKPLAPLFIGIEMANLVALYMSQRAVDLGSPSLASAMETTVPGYTFLLTILLLSLKHRFGNEEARYELRTKLILVGIMTAGVMQLA